MNSSYLWIHVKEARIYEDDPNNHVEVLVTLQIGSSAPYTTAKAVSPHPKWNEDVMLTVKDSEMMDALILELYKPKFLFGKMLLGRSVIPLISIRHSNKVSTGLWVHLFLPSPDGSKLPTQHEICLDVHFELPRDIPAEVIEQLERKLEEANTILEEEVETLENQEHRLATGALAPPSTGPGRVPSAHGLPLNSKYKDSPSHSDHIDGQVPLYRDGVDYCQNETDMTFKDFEWTRNQPTPEHLRKRGSHPISLTHKRVEYLQESSMATRSLDRRLFRTPSPAMSDRDHNEGAAARGRSSSQLGSKPRVGQDYDADQRFSSQRARSLWQHAFQLIKPEVEKRLSAKAPSFPIGGHGAFTLSQLVDKLKSYKIKSKEISEQDIQTFSTANSQFRSRSRSVLDVKKRNMRRKHFIDEKVRMGVYKRALEALLYPASEPDSHIFESYSARRPITCSECNYLLWGLKKQGLKCTRCGKVVHERCSSLCSQDCFIHDQHSAISEKMHRMSVNHHNRFEMLQQAFNVSEEQQKIVKEEVETRILKLAENFNAEISITVLTAQGLLIPTNMSPRTYVTVAVGNEKEQQRTEVFKRKSDDDKNPPTWNQEFLFTCNNYHEAIQLRVWNERDSVTKVLAAKLTKEGDHFLGEKIIEVRRVGPSQEVWYKLQKRAEKGPDVSGYIKVSISVTIEGESLTPFHQQYIKLHEQMFFHCHVNNDTDLIIVPPRVNPDDNSTSGTMQLLPNVAQEIVDEFALRYAIEPIFRMMLHIELLVNHHSVRKAMVVINNMLKNLKYQMFIHVAADHAVRAVGATVLMEEYMDASNFGRDKFSQLLDKLLDALRLDLQRYREFYPHKDDQKLSELVETFELLGTVIEFQQQAMGLLTANKASDLILENMKECLKNTFEFIVQSNMSEGCTGHPALDPNRPPFDFFYQVIIQMKCVIFEDRTIYGKFIAKYCKVVFGDVSAIELWHLFSSTIEGLFDTEANLEIFPVNEYITLLFTIKHFYDTEIKSIPCRKDMFPEYPSWFTQCVHRWLLQFQKDGLFFLNNAWDDDKNSLKFAPHENQKLSSSAFQMFFYLHQGLEFILGLELSDPITKDIHFEDFSKVIITVIQYYVDKVAATIPEYSSDLETSCMLLNNLQALRSSIHEIFKDMGGTENAGAASERLLTDFQSTLTKQLTSWCATVARSLTTDILTAIKVVQEEIFKLKGQKAVERDDIKEIVKPLFDVLTERLRVIVTVSETVVMQKSIKEVWYICLESLHHMLLPTLKWEHAAGVHGHRDVYFSPHHYTPRQCGALDIMADLLKDFFKAAESQGIKMSTIDRGIKQLKGLIALYRETTEMLIGDFLMDHAKNRLQATEALFGEVNLEVDAYSHPTTGELDGTIRVISAVALKGFSGSGGLKPLIELNLISPTVSSNQRKFITDAKSTNNPIFNKTFRFTLANWKNSELLILAKNHSTFGKNKIIGVALISCHTLADEGSLTLGLAHSCPISDRGQAILNVLSVRTYDDIAKEFVALKMSCRSKAEEGEDLTGGKGAARAN